MSSSVKWCKRINIYPLHSELVKEYHRSTATDSTQRLLVLSTNINFLDVSCPVTELIGSAGTEFVAMRIREFGTSITFLFGIRKWQNFPFSLSFLSPFATHPFSIYRKQSSLSLSMRAAALIFGVLATGVLLITYQGASALPVFETGTWQKKANVSRVL